MEKKYIAIYNSETREEFEKLVKYYEIKGFDYFAFSEHNLINQTNKFIMSNEEWQKEYDQNNYALHDPIRKSSVTIPEGIAPFECILPSDPFAIKIMERRKRYSMQNGIIIIHDYKGMRYQLTLASSNNSLNVVQQVLKYRREIDYLINDLKRLSQTHF